MFERSKKDESSTETAASTGGGAQGFLGSGASKPAPRGADCAVIGRSIQINGDLRGDEDLRIEGDVSGTVQLRNSNLTIGREGKVRADVFAKSIVVDGTTKGDLYATERVAVHINARVQGNIVAPKVSIEEGARFKGSIEMDQAAVEKALGKSDNTASDSKSAKGGTAKSPAPKPVPEKSAKEAAAGLNPPSGTA